MAETGPALDVFDVEDVELKGMPMTVEWGARRGEVRGVTFGSLAKMPRDWRRIGEWEGTTCMTAHELRELPERFAVAEPEAEPVPEKEGQGRSSGRVRCSGKLVDPDDVRKLEPLARKLLRGDRQRSRRRRPGQWLSPRTCR